MELLKRTPAAYLGSCRYKLPEIHEDPEVYEKIFAILEKLQSLGVLEVDITVGGDGVSGDGVNGDGYFRKMDTAGQRAGFERAAAAADQALDVLDERCRPHPQVFTVDGFQGHEREYIILSTVKGSRKVCKACHQDHLNP